MKIFYALVCSFTLFAAGTAHAGLFIPKGSHMSMAMYSPDSQSVELAHGFTRDWSGSVGYHRYLSDDEQIEREFYTLQASYLALRLFQDDGIANVYVLGGPLLAHSQESSDDKLGFQTGLWADYETRRIYTRASVQTHWTSAFSQTVMTGQALWAPYAADYEEVATWIGLQVERRNGLSNATQVTPLLRFFQRSWWVDGGVSVNSKHRGDVFINLMLLF